MKGQVCHDAQVTETGEEVEKQTNKQHQIKKIKRNKMQIRLQCLKNCLGFLKISSEAMQRGGGGGGGERV